ncbi:OsmC family protein [Amycolatopsis rhabdoformis]|uniref:OsmC family protein n=1 Tax=Amycolatopsis rhabdoformis TaxID=1448059 RepID=A0ABZ1IM38_9PSEU|nr:OsmC family protein [Amycolatopsis rhabdoformis]WSE34748.1 OsmC family protein [Amycolatopsis rhabdoformis]
MPVINGFDVTALRETVAAVTEERRLGHVTFAVQGEWQGGLAVRSTTGALVQGGVRDPRRAGKFVLESDEPAALLGGDTAVSPGEYVLQALAGCYTVTLVANAAAQGIELRKYRLALEADFDLSGFLGIDKAVSPGVQELRVTVDVDAPEASREQLEELVKLVEQRSPIRDTLVRGVTVTTKLA